MTSLPQTDPPRLAHEALPTMYDLPSEEIGDPGMPDQFHVHQATLLDETVTSKSSITAEDFR